MSDELMKPVTIRLRRDMIAAIEAALPDAKREDPSQFARTAIYQRLAREFPHILEQFPGKLDEPGSRKGKGGRPTHAVTYRYSSTPMGGLALNDKPATSALTPGDAGAKKAKGKR